MTRRSAPLIALALGTATLMATLPARAVVPGPDGRIAFCRNIPEIDSCDLYTANPDGTDEQLLLAGPAEAPHWSPDGSQLAVVTFAGDLVVTGIVNPDGSGLVQLNTGLTFNTPAQAWSPDGSRLACASAGPLWTARNHPGRVGPRISSRAWLIQQEVTERTEKTSLLSTPGSISQLQGSNTSHKRGGARTLVEWHLDKPGSAGVPAGELAENCGKAPALPGGTRLS